MTFTKKKKKKSEVEVEKVTLSHSFYTVWETTCLLSWSVTLNWATMLFCTA